MYSQQYEPAHDYDPREVAYRHLATAMLIATVVIGLMTLFPFEQLYAVYAIGSIVEIGVIFLLLFAGLFRKQFSESTALTILIVFAVASSVTLGFIVNIALTTLTNGIAIVFGTFGLSGVVIFGIWGYTKTVKPDVSGMYKWVMIASIIFILFAFFGIFFLQGWDLFFLIISGVGALLFAVYMYIDFARLERYEFNSPAMMALWLFYDIIFFIKYLLMFMIHLFGDN
ncbi:MAG: Bax inhibitor-1 family protein [Candidatus Hodarchaeales archaeon]|jgi:FtsH-binding integral membrane protein